MIDRWMLGDVVESLRYRRIVHITGARQTGKTTLASSEALCHGHGADGQLPRMERGGRLP